MTKASKPIVGTTTKSIAAISGARVEVCFGNPGTSEMHFVAALDGVKGMRVEDTLTLWVPSLRDIKQRIRPLFMQELAAASAGQFLDGLVGNEPRGWMRAEAAGDPGPCASKRSSAAG